MCNYTNLHCNVLYVCTYASTSIIKTENSLHPQRNTPVYIVYMADLRQTHPADGGHTIT